MKIAGFVPLSLCDYPGHVAAVVFTQGCNFNCPFCHNAHLVPSDPQDGAGLLDGEEILATLAERQARLQGVVVTGGEPIIQKGLAPFLARVRGLGLKTKLDTNGASPELLKALLQQDLLNFVAMDIKAPWSKYDQLAGVRCNVEALRESIALIAASGVAHQFRTTRYDVLLDADDYDEIVRQVPEKSPHVWQEYRPVAKA